MINADCTGSGPVDERFEDFIKKHVFPYYANVHSDAFCSGVMSEMIQRSREIIKKACVHDTDEYALIFTGHGMTGAARHLAFVLAPSVVSVMYSTLEHVSNSSLWECVFPKASVNVIEVSTKDPSIIEKDHLSMLLHDSIVSNTKRGILLIAFTACSNVLGRVQPVQEITSIIDSYRKKASEKGLKIVTCVDCAACAPYFPLKEICRGNDAIVFSPHKFKGGQGTPGVLIVKKSLLVKEIPFYPGGGTVWYKHKKTHNHFLNDSEHREEGGTPNIIGCIRTGLLFQHKIMHQSEVLHRLRSIVGMVDRFFNENREMMSLIEMFTCINTHAKERLPIYSFRVENTHPGLFVKVLSDEYGIQTRSGVSCCYLLAEELCKTKRAERDIILSGKGTPNRYGWVRVSFHYDLNDSEIMHVLHCMRELMYTINKYKSMYRYECSMNKWYHVYSDVNNTEIPKIVNDMFSKMF